jgi:hypothetical protein
VNDLERFESELQRREPARPPEAFMARLLTTQPAPRSRPERIVRESFEAIDCRRFWRWLVPATVLVVGAMVVWRTALRPGVPSHTGPAVADAPALKADDVHITEQLVSSFDAVAKLPTGEPVRFRCQKWVDQVVLSDKKRGVVIEQRTPRVEVVPVRFETY